jgi:hypothetical protein
VTKSPKVGPLPILSISLVQHGTIKKEEYQTFSLSSNLGPSQPNLLERAGKHAPVLQREERKTMREGNEGAIFT